MPMGCFDYNTEFLKIHQFDIYIKDIEYVIKKVIDNPNPNYYFHKLCRLLVVDKALNLSWVMK